MNWIELMGPSGIGKSTFKRNLVRQKGADDLWVLPSEALLEIAKQSKQKKVQKKLLQSLLTNQLVRTGEGMLARYLLDPKTAYLKEAQRYAPLLKNKIEHHLRENQGDPVEMAYRISLFKGIIQDMCLLDHHNYQKPVLLEVGPYNHSITFDSRLPDDIPASSLPTAFIFCHLDLQTNLERLRIREKKGKTVPLHRNLQGIQLENLVSIKQQVYLEKAKFLKRLPVPYIDIDLKEDQTSNVKKVQAFLKTIL